MSDRLFPIPSDRSVMVSRARAGSDAFFLCFACHSLPVTHDIALIVSLHRLMPISTPASDVIDGALRHSIASRRQLQLCG